MNSEINQQILDQTVNLLRMFPNENTALDFLTGAIKLSEEDAQKHIAAAKEKVAPPFTPAATSIEPKLAQVIAPKVPETVVDDAAGATDDEIIADVAGYLKATPTGDAVRFVIDSYDSVEQGEAEKFVEAAKAIATTVEPTGSDTASLEKETPEEKNCRLETALRKSQIKIEELDEEYDILQEESMAKTDELLAAKKKLGEEPVAPVKKPSNKLFTMPADMIEPKRIEWLWPYKIPLNKLSVLAGNPDQGKSLVSLYIAAQVTRGLPMFGETTKMDPGEVLIMAAEDEADDTIRPRLEAAGAALSRVHILQSITCRDGKGKAIADREVQLDTDLQAVEAMLKDNPNIKLVIIDPISSFLGRANMNREQEVRSVLTPLKNLAARCHVAIVTVMHLNKNGDASAIHRIGGAVAFTGVARAVWLFMEDPEDKTRRLMLRVKNNIAKSGGGLAYHTTTKPIMIDGLPEFQPYVEWLGGTEQAASDVLISGAPVGRPPEKTEGAKEWLAKFLAEGEQTATDIEKFGKRAGHALRTLERAKSELKATSEKINGRWCWIIPRTEPGKTGRL